jgi:flagellar operon protein
VKDAIGKLRAKGGQNSLIVSDKAAYIVDVKNNKLVTAVDKGSMSENIFTKIDSTMFIN